MDPPLPRELGDVVGVSDGSEFFQSTKRVTSNITEEASERNEITNVIFSITAIARKSKFCRRSRPPPEG